MGRSLFGPFDETDTCTGKVFVKPGIQKLIGVIEPVKIKVEEV